MRVLIHPIKNALQTSPQKPVIERGSMRKSRKDKIKRLINILANPNVKIIIGNKNSFNNGRIIRFSRVSIVAVTRREIKLGTSICSIPVN